MGRPAHRHHHRLFRHRSPLPVAAPARTTELREAHPHSITSSREPTRLKPDQEGTPARRACNQRYEPGGKIASACASRGEFAKGPLLGSSFSWSGAGGERARQSVCAKNNGRKPSHPQSLWVMKGRASETHREATCAFIVRVRLDHEGWSPLELDAALVGRAAHRCFGRRLQRRRRRRQFWNRRTSCDGWPAREHRRQHERERWHDEHRRNAHDRWQRFHGRRAARGQRSHASRGQRRSRRSWHRRASNERRNAVMLKSCGCC